MRRLLASVAVAALAVGVGCSSSDEPQTAPPAEGLEGCEAVVAGLDDPKAYVLADIDALAADPSVQQFLTPEEVASLRANMEAVEDDTTLRMYAFAACMGAQGAICRPSEVQPGLGAVGFPEICDVEDASGAVVESYENPWVAQTTVPGLEDLEGSDDLEGSQEGEP